MRSAGDRGPARRQHLHRQTHRLATSRDVDVIYVLERGATQRPVTGRRSALEGLGVSSHYARRKTRCEVGDVDAATNESG
jgi:hypothetical protein